MIMKIVIVMVIAMVVIMMITTMVMIVTRSIYKCNLSGEHIALSQHTKCEHRIKKAI